MGFKIEGSQHSIVPDVKHLSSWLPTDTSSVTPSVECKLEEYHVEKTAQTINNYCRKPENNIALQFPDSLLPDAPFISQALNEYLVALSASNDVNNGEEPHLFFVYVLGDTSYGECCVDEVAAQHLDTHIIVHYGSACLSSTRALPVLYVFPQTKMPVDGQTRTVRALGKTLEVVGAMSAIDHIVVLYDIELHEYFKHLHTGPGNDDDQVNNLDAYFSHGKQVQVAKLRLDNPDDIQLPKNDRNSITTEQNSTHKFVGHLKFDESTLTYARTAFIWFSVEHGNDDSDIVSTSARNAGLLLSSGTYPCKLFEVININSDEAKTDGINIDVSRILRKRFAQLQKLEQAERIGIVAGTLGVSGNTTIIERCVRIVEHAGKRAYILLVGKLNDVKLSNFPDLDAFVIVACARNSLIDPDITRLVQQPIITPVELEAALLGGGDIFSERYSTDFADLLQRHLVLDEDSNSNASDQGDNDEKTDECSNFAMTKRGDWSVSVSGSGGGADFLNQRSWKGLVYDRGGNDDEIPIEELGLDVKEGQHGIASRYEREVSSAQPQ